MMVLRANTIWMQLLYVFHDKRFHELSYLISDVYLSFETQKQSKCNIWELWVVTTPFVFSFLFSYFWLLFLCVFSFRFRWWLNESMVDAVWVDVSNNRGRVKEKDEERWMGNPSRATFHLLSHSSEGSPLPSFLISLCQQVSREA